MTSNFPLKIATGLLIAFMCGTRAEALIKKGADEAKSAVQAKIAGKYQLALAHYDNAIAKNPTPLLWHIERARILMQLLDYKHALEEFTYILKQEPNNAYALEARAHALESLGDHKGALTACNEVLRINPIDINALDLRRQIYENLGRQKDAAADLTLATKYGFTKETRDALSAAANATAHKQPLRAAQILQKQIARCPVCPHLYLELCRTWMANELKSAPEIAATAALACEHSPTGSSFWRQGHGIQALAYSMQSKHKEALQEFDRALEGVTFRSGKKGSLSGITADDLDFVLYHRSETCGVLGNWTAAADDLTKLMNNHFENAEYFKARAKCYHNLHKIDKAIAELQAAQELEPDDVNLSLRLVDEYKAAKMWAQEITILNRLLIREPEDELLYSDRAEAYVKLGQDKRAISDLTKLIELNPGDDKFYRQRAVAYRRLGMTSLAEADEKQFKAK